MPQREFKTEITIEQPIEKVFAFFSEAKNLETITPPWLNFKILSQSTEQIQKNTLFEYRLRIHGINTRWVTRISEWNPPHFFVDEQTVGPYALWRHTHSFESLENSKTFMKDIVQYELPFGKLGDLLAHWKVKSDIRSIFAYREKSFTSKNQSLFESNGF